MKTTVSFCKGWDVHIFFVEEIIIYGKKLRLSGYLN